MTGLLNLTGGELMFVVSAVFIAGVVRGFSGFALSALVMASTVWIIPPIALIPICWFLEMAASLLMVRGGFREADNSIVIGLVIGSIIGTPLGLALTTALPVETSKLIALVIILILALTQLLNLRLPFLATRPGLYGSGLLAGIVTGLASVGGMVVALYVLARQAPARVMRASLVMFLFLTSLTSFIYLWLYGMMTPETIWRGLLLSVPALAGVVAGKALFRPVFEQYYRPFCLSLLVFLAGLGLVRTAF